MRSTKHIHIVCRLLGAEQIDEDGRAVLYLVSVLNVHNAACLHNEARYAVILHQAEL